MDFKLEKVNGKWFYDDRFLEWLRDNSYKYAGKNKMAKEINLSEDTLYRILKKENIVLIFNTQLNKYSPDYKAQYQDYDWCYQKYIIERKSHKEMAEELNVSLRVIQKWCVEKHKLHNHSIKYELKINEIQRDLIIGSLLGDGHIDKRDTQPIFIVSHAENQKDYLFWKYNIMKNLCHTPPRYKKEAFSMFNNKLYKCQPFYRFQTKIIYDLKEYKKMNKNVLIKNLNEFSLSIYFLDDGHRNKSNWILCFASFLKNEKQIFVEVLKNKFNIDSKIDTDNRYLTISSNSSRLLDEIILRNIPNNLDIIQYKIINKKKTKESNYIYIIDDNKKIGISAYFRNNKKRNYKKIRDYLLKNGIKEIKVNDLINLEGYNE